MSAVEVPDAEPTPVRWRLDIAYDGTEFSGWARQDDRRTVQGELERWLGRILRSPEPRLVCAGRTDAGVHARGQVAHVDLPPDAVPDPDRLRTRLARALPGDVVVATVRRAPAGFDARFAAIWRRYCYRLADAATPRPDPLLRRHVLGLGGELDLDRVNAAAEPLLGLRDFATFCRRREGATSVRTLLALRAERVASGPYAGIVEVGVRADAFCHSMVRSLVGGLVEVGLGRQPAEWLREAAATAQRDGTVPVLPATGLTLEEVGYPADDALAERARTARSRRELPGD